jgi:hypothetical protein
VAGKGTCSEGCRGAEQVHINMGLHKKRETEHSPVPDIVEKTMGNVQLGEIVGGRVDPARFTWVESVHILAGSGLQEDQVCR